MSNPLPDRLTSDIEVLPSCDRCGVAYIEDYEGPCQEPAPNAQWEGEWSRMCGGTVSWRSTAERFARRLEGDDACA